MYCGFEGSKGRERKHGNKGGTVVPNILLRNAGFLHMRNDFLNVFSLDPAVSSSEKYGSVGVKMRGAVPPRPPIRFHVAVPNA